MESIPPEIILMIIDHLSKRNQYDEIVSFAQTCLYYHELVSAEKEKIFTGMHYLAWLYSKPSQTKRFHRQIQAHYGSPIETIISKNQLHIPDIRNNLNYSSDVAIEQFLSIRILLRDLLMQPLPDLMQDINIFNKELDFLCDLTIKFMMCILDRIAAAQPGQHWSANIKLIENINFTAGSERSQFLAFFHCMNRLNPLTIRVASLLVLLKDSSVQ